MTRYADPQRCPDCSQPIEYGAPRCTGCGLPLRGVLAQQLFQTLCRADELLVALRRGSGVASVPAAVPTATPAAGPTHAPAAASAPSPGPAAEPPPGPASGPASGPAARPAAVTALSGASVPKILLGLGAGCLLVAALVFLAVTWSVMGVGGRTATLVGFTAISGGLTYVVATRGLRGAVEALGLVCLGLVALDLAGGRSAGWLGDVSVPAFAVTLGVVLAGAAAGSALLLRRTPSGGFTSGEVVTGLGLATAVGGLVTDTWGSTEGRLLVATLVAGAAVAGLEWLGLRVAAAASSVVAVLAWLALGTAGYLRVLEEPTVAHVWSEAAAWPALAAAATTLVVVAVRRLPMAVRQAAASVAVAITAFVVVAPVLDEQATEVTLVLIALLAASSAVLWFAPKPWSAASLLTLVAAALATGTVVLTLGGTAAGRLLTVAVERGRFLDTLPPRDGLELHPWLLLPAVASLGWALEATLRYAGRAPAQWTRALPFVGVAAAVATAASYPVPVWVVVVAGTAAGVAFLALGRLPSGAVALGGGLVVSLHSDGLTALALAVVLLAAGWLVLRDARPTVRFVAATVGQLALAASVWTWGDLLDRPGEWVAAAGLVAVAVVAVAVRRVNLEVGAALGVAGLFLAGSLAAPAAEAWTWVAVYLTLAGAAVSVQALLRDDRRELGWVGGLLLAMASWVRLADIGVEEPEPYTLPAALALLVVGLAHLRRHSDAGTLAALSPGLGLALVPSLLWVLADPGTMRSGVLGLACLALVVAGVELRWTAPLVYAGTAGALVVLRHAAPYIGEGVPRWVLIGAAGVLLVALGVTWEHRIRELRAVLGYVRNLR